MRTQTNKPHGGLLGRERREETRFNADSPLRVDVTDLTTGRKFYGWAGNLSSGGIFIETREQLAKGTRVELTAMPRSGLMVFRLKLTGLVAHSGKTGMGIEFEHSDSEMDQVVRRLLERFETGIG